MTNFANVRIFASAIVVATSIAILTGNAKFAHGVDSTLAREASKDNEMEKS
jgi:hypothetical protein